MWCLTSDLRGDRAGAPHAYPRPAARGRGPRRRRRRRPPGAAGRDVRLDGEAREGGLHPRTDAALPRAPRLHPHADHLEEDQPQVLRRRIDPRACGDRGRVLVLVLLSVLGLLEYLMGENAKYSYLYLIWST